MFINLLEKNEKELIPGYKARFLHTKHLTCVYWNIDQGAAFPAHSHLHEQTVNIISGKFYLTIGNKSKLMLPGDLAVIPSNVIHSGHAETACMLIDIFFPIREDYLENNKIC